MCGTVQRWSRTPLLVVLGIALLRLSTGQELSVPQPRTQRGNEEPLLVSLVNGDLVALDRQTGHTLWTLDTGSPLLTSWTSNDPEVWKHKPQHANLQHEQDPHGPHGTPASPADYEQDASQAHQPDSCGSAEQCERQQDPFTGRTSDPGGPSRVQPLQVFPGVDGSLYMLQDTGADDGGAGEIAGSSRLQRLPLNVEELVRQSPSLTQNDGLLMGKRQTSVYVVDSATGRVLHVYMDHQPDRPVEALKDMQQQQQQQEEQQGSAQGGLSGSRLIVAREDYHLQSIDVASSTVYWNLTYSKLRQLSFHGEAALPASAAEGQIPEGLVLHRQGMQIAATGPTAGPLLGPSEGATWATDLPAPVMSVLPSSALSAQQGAADVAALNALQQLEENAAKAQGRLQQQQTVAISEYRGQLYARVLPGQQQALPALQRLAEAGDSGTQEQPSDPAGESKSLMLLDRPVDEPVLLYDTLQCPSNDLAAEEVAIPAFLPLPSRPVASNGSHDAPAESLYGHQGQVVLVVSGEWVLLAFGGGGSTLVAFLVWRLMLRQRSHRAVKHAEIAVLQENNVKLQQASQPQAKGSKGRKRGAKAARNSAAASSKEQARLSAGGAASTVGPAQGGSNTPGQNSPQAPAKAERSTVVGAQPSSTASLVEEGANSLMQEGTASSVPSDGPAAAKGAHAPPAAGSPHAKIGGPGSPAAAAAPQQPAPSSPDTAAGSSLSTSPIPYSPTVLEGLAVPSTQPVLASAVQQREQLEGGMVRVGHIELSNVVLGHGSGGTVVYQGTYNGRPVAVKKMLRHMYELAHKELGALILSDEHPNVVRCFAVEEDHEFLYLALERCKCSLANMSSDESFLRLFIDEEGTRPTSYAMDVIRDICEGIRALHERGIVHRDLKPHNVLLTESGRAKVSDMGLSKRLSVGESSFETLGTPGGSSGWQSPEQLVSRSGGQVKQSRSMDVFSLGILLYYVLTGGAHPFGATYERDFNILSGRPNLSALSDWPEALNLVTAMLASDPKKRPNMAVIMQHILWWPAAKQLQFLIQVSDRTEYKEWEEDNNMLATFESYAPAAFNKAGGLSEVAPAWASLLDPALLQNLGRHRRYSTSSLRDLLRVIRNKHNHFRELPSSVQQLLSPLPEGYLRYFTSIFPQLLLAVYAFVCSHLSHDEHLASHLHPQLLAYPFHKLFMKGQPKELPVQDRPHRETIGGPPPPSLYPRPGPGSPLQVPGHLPGPPPWASAVHMAPPFPASSDAHAQDNPRVSGGLAPGSAMMSYKAAATGGAAAEAAANGPSKKSDGEVQGNMVVVDTRSATDAAGAGGNGGQDLLDVTLPPAFAGNRSIRPVTPEQLLDLGAAGPTAQAYLMGHNATACLPPLLTGEHPLLGGRFVLCVFPRRPGQLLCDFFMRTGHCKYGLGCRFDHPEHGMVPLSMGMLPLRPGQLPCSFYVRNGVCKFGPSCRYHHPDLGPAPPFEPAVGRLQELLDDPWAMQGY